MLTILPLHASPAAGRAEEATLLRRVDDLCRCTGLHRKSSFQSRHDSLATLLLDADGVTEPYWVRFTEQGYPAEFGPDKYRVHYELPLVQSEQQRRFCVQAVERLNRSECSWDHFGAPQVAVDAPRGFRVRYRSQPGRRAETSFSTSGFIYFLLTARGTTCSVWYGE